MSDEPGGGLWYEEHQHEAQQGEDAAEAGQQPPTDVLRGQQTVQIVQTVQTVKGKSGVSRGWERSYLTLSYLVISSHFLSFKTKNS